jgi:hypothetical protein
MEKMSTFPNEMIHIMLRGTVHLHGHWDKMVPFMKPSILVDFSKALSSIATHVSQLMTFKATIFHIGSITTTSATKM